MRILTLVLVMVAAVALCACDDDVAGPAPTADLPISLVLPERALPSVAAPTAGQTSRSSGTHDPTRQEHESSILKPQPDDRVDSELTVTQQGAPPTGISTASMIYPAAIGKVLVQAFDGTTPVGSRVELTVSGTQASGTIRALEVGKAYVLVVEVLDESGRLLYAAESSITVSAQMPAVNITVQSVVIEPGSASAQVLGDTAIEVTWTGPSGSGFQVTGYEVRASPSGAAACPNAALRSTTAGTRDTLVLDAAGEWWVCLQTTITRSPAISPSVQTSWAALPSSAIVTQVPTALEAASATSVSDSVGAVVEAAVKVRDQFADSIVGAIVAFGVTAGDGEVTASPVPTAANGIAAAQWTLGTTAGENGLEATFAPLAPVAFVATATAGAIDTLAVVAAADSGTVGTPLSVNPSVRVADRHGNPIVGVELTFTPRTGSVAGSPVATDASGVASAVWTLGEKAATVSDTMVVTAAGYADSLLIVATATPGTETRLTLEAPANQNATVATEVPSPPGISVADQFGNPKAGVEVTFTASGTGLAAGSPDTTDAAGQAAATSWTLGTTAGTGSDTLWVAVGGTTADTFFVATAVPGPPASLVLTEDGVSLSGVGTGFQLMATVEDAHGNVIPDPSLTWASLNANIATVDAATGLATAVDAGQVTISATVGDLIAYALLTVNVPEATAVNAWSPVSSPVPNDLLALWGAAPDGIWTVGRSVSGVGAIVGYAGTAWSTATSPATADINAVWGSSSSNVWAVGDGGEIAHYDGTGWSAVSSPTGGGLRAVWGSAPTDVWAVGSGPSLIHFDGTQWTATTPPTTGTYFTGIWGVAADDVWIVAGDGTIYRFDGSGWNAVPSPTGNSLLAVWGSSTDDVWAVGDGGTIVHWDGVDWSAVGSPTSQTLYGVWGSASNEVWSVGSSGIGGGTLLHFAGTDWTEVGSGTPNTLQGAWGSALANAWVVGDNGTILRGTRGASVTIETREPLNFIGDTLQYAVTVRDSAGTVIPGVAVTVWESLNPTIATVDSAGVVLARDVGVVQIVAEVAGGARDTLSVTVQQVPAEITVTPAGASVVDVGSQQGFTASAMDSGGAAVANPVFTWSSLNLDVATINAASGVATAQRDGQVTIKAELDGVAGYALLTISVTDAVPVTLWTPAETPLDGFGIWGSAATDVWAGSGEYLKHFDGAVWDSVNPGPPGAFWIGIWGTGGDDVWAIDFSANNIAHFDGSSWQLVDYVPDADATPFRAIWGSGPDDIWIGTYGAKFMHYDGQDWTAEPVPCLGTRAMWGVARDNVLAVGPCIMRYNGAAWVGENVPGATGTMRGVWGTGSDDIWLVGDGQIFQFDGTSWTLAFADVTACDAYSGVWGSGTSGEFSSRDIYVGTGGGVCGDWAGFLDIGGYGPPWGFWGTAYSDVWAGPGQRGLRGVHLEVSSSNSTTLYPYHVWKTRPNVPMDVTVAARTGFTPGSGDLVPEYRGTVHFEDLGLFWPKASVSVPPDYRFVPADGGTVTFPAGVTYAETGHFALSVWDSANVITDAGSALWPSLTVQHVLDVIVADPQITAANPAGFAGDMITITGSGFAAPNLTTYVRVGNLFLTEYTVDSDNQITAVMPTHSAGSYPVQVGVGIAPDTMLLVMSNGDTWTQTVDFDESATEPANDDYNTAPSIATTFDFTGTVSPSDLNDLFRIAVPVGADVEVTLDWDTDADVDIYWADVNGALFACGGGCSVAKPEVSRMSLSAGTYFLWINLYDGPAGLTTYRVTGSLWRP